MGAGMRLSSTFRTTTRFTGNCRFQWASGRFGASGHEKIRETIREIKPDIVDIHNFFPLISPAVYYAARDEGVPAVQTLHNYRLLCPNSAFMRSGRVCEDCLGKFFPYPGVVHACYKHSHLMTAAVASMIAVHRALNTWNNVVSAYVVLTEFARQKFIEGGLPPEKLYLKPNFLVDPGAGDGKGGYFLFVGRLSEEKGVDILLKAWRKLPQNIRLKIVGTGPLEMDVAAMALGMPNVEVHAAVPIAEVYDLMGAATAVILPAVWYEGLPRVIMEAFRPGFAIDRFRSRRDALDGYAWQKRLLIRARERRCACKCCEYNVETIGNRVQPAPGECQE